ncbi:MAG TPA: sigma-70 family RNA polymerase sigma factor [Candidatus Paceibacterota bacterium]|nr:sigma-70 family RNA polymerase sigma factor [Candidatus Paceibacterota bacterium]HSA03503.1 sigma-70 family RNA polymerase sigma factor [Candidatus Paceibacterota bacterium]
MNDVTRVLNAIQQGDSRAAEELLPLVYEELRRLAASKMAHEAPGHTLQATALVHEAWLRLVTVRDQNWESRAHFFSAAAEAMRRILVDHARRKRSLKRGGNSPREEYNESALVLCAPPDELLAVHEALDSLACHDPQAAELVKFRYFVGMTMEESAEAIGLPVRTAERLWTYARAWLHRDIRRQATVG